MFDQHLLNPTRGIVRTHLSEHTKKPLKIGNNFIQVLKILEKWVTIAESRNDLVQSQKRVPLKDSIVYFEYKKFLLSTSTSLSDDLVDPKTQNKQYQQQYENYYETFIDVQNALKIVWRTHSPSHSFHLTDNSLKIEFPGYHVTITDIGNGYLTLSTNRELSTIDDHQNYTFLNAYNETANLLYGSTKESTEFNIDFHQLLLYKKQLKLLVTFVQSDSMSQEDVDIRNQIKTFILSAKKGQTLTFEYEPIDMNGMIFKRTFNVIKLTKIRTVVKVFAKCEDIELTEYNKTFTKVSHQIDYHTDEIQKLYLANK